MTDEPLPFQPLIIIGAARSGTNALRDMLTRLPGFGTWPCDEINAVWRHGNLRHPSDALPPERATAEIRSFVRGAFVAAWRRQGHPDILVEKTCANTLRVPFVDAILPEAHFVHILRDGRAVVPSAMKRWRGELELPALGYYLRKLRYVPLIDLPVYAGRYLKNRIALRSGSAPRMAMWGPRPDGFRADPEVPLDVLCARQWGQCVTSASTALADIAPDRRITITYERMVANPATVLTEIAGMLGRSPSPDDIGAASDMIRRGAARDLPPLSSEAEAHIASVHVAQQGGGDAA
ncbi:sulfotransferase [uncultured Jannaschia sp.]|uniref:sulfotransferase family protein n=1 Tax=uncultured Jannaschia sp. TaxID=293347 RepID=UPI00262554A1|nr:sulfotransferase [uncultured Jannaschia sp.]